MTQKNTPKKIKQPKLRKQLTADEVNFTVDVLRDISRGIQSWQAEAKHLNRQLYSAVDKADSSTTPLFNEMNKLRTKIRKTKVMNKRIGSIIHKLKTQR